MSLIKTLKTLFCLGEEEDKPTAARPVIGVPTKFHEVELQLAGLSAAQQADIRAHAAEGRARMFASLKPIVRVDGTSPAPLVAVKVEPGTQLAWVRNDPGKFDMAGVDPVDGTTPADDGEVVAKDFAYRR